MAPMGTCAICPGEESGVQEDPHHFPDPSWRQNIFQLFIISQLVINELLRVSEETKAGTGPVAHIDPLARSYLEFCPK